MQKGSIAVETILAALNLDPALRRHALRDLGVHPSTYWRWQVGQTRPQRRYRRALAKATRRLLDVPPVDLRAEDHE